MTTIALKKQIRKKLDKALDEEILEIIDKLLDKAALNPVLKYKLSNRALKSEENIKDGNVYSKTGALKKIKRF
ncbi:MAG: hypothetical protein ACOZCO_03415 [Bacteroidota bacterium]